MHFVLRPRAEPPDCHAPLQAVFYVPREGEDMSSAAVAVPVLESLVTVTGVQGSAPVTGLSFEGLVFEHSTWLLPSSGEGYIDNQVRLLQE